MSAISSTIPAMCGSVSLTQAPFFPYCLNLYGVPSIFGTPLMNANRCPFSSSSGHGFMFSSTSFGL